MLLLNILISILSKIVYKFYGLLTNLNYFEKQIFELREAESVNLSRLLFG